MSITLTVAATTLALSDDLRWLDEAEWSPVEQSVERSITGDHLTVELDRLAAERGTYPAVLRCDNGPELACNAMGLFRLDGGVLA